MQFSTLTLLLLSVTSTWAFPLSETTSYTPRDLDTRSQGLKARHGPAAAGGHASSSGATTAHTEPYKPHPQEWFQTKMQAVMTSKKISPEKLIFYDSHVLPDGAKGVEFLENYKKEAGGLSTIRDVFDDEITTEMNYVHDENNFNKDADKHEKAYNAFWKSASEAYAHLASGEVHMLLPKKGDAPIDPADSKDQFLKDEYAILKSKSVKIKAVGVTGGVADTTSK